MMNDILDDILYEDKEMILLHKPGGIAVQTARLGQKDLVSMLKNYRAGKNEDPYIGVVHRLDQPVEFYLQKRKKLPHRLAASFSRIRRINVTALSSAVTKSVRLRRVRKRF